MSEQQLDFPAIDLKPIVSYPREAQAGETYLMTIDVQLASPDIPWPYPEEEYPISFILDTQPYFSYEPLDGHERSVVLHCFGGTYGPVQYVLTATSEAVQPGHIHVTLINGGGMPIGHIELECSITSKTTGRKRKTAIERQAARTREQAPSVPVLFEGLPDVQPGKSVRNRVEEQLLQAGWMVLDVPKIAGIANERPAITFSPEESLLLMDGLEQAGLIPQNASEIAETANKEPVLFFISPEDKPASIRQRLEKTRAPRILLFFRKQTQVRSKADWQWLHNCARDLHKEVVVGILDPQIRSVAQAAGFRVVLPTTLPNIHTDDTSSVVTRERLLTSPSNGPRNVAPAVYRPQAIAFREFPLLSGRADYLLVVDGEAIGVIEVKTGESFPRSAQSIQDQLWQYQNAQPANPSFIRFQRRPLPFAYGVVGHEIQFTNHLEPDARTRSVFHFHRPETLALWLSQAPVSTPNDLNELLRSRLRRMPPLQDENITNQEVFQALTELEKSLAANRPRALVQMPRGVGNTLTLAYMAYRLIYHAHAQRVLFLVNSVEYAQIVYNCFEKIKVPGQTGSFVEQYRVQILRNIKIDASARVVISTVVQLYMALIKEKNALIFDEAHFSPQGFSERHLLPLTEVPYNNALPLECFDAIMINNCPSEAYRDWRPLLEYFDAFIIGATNSVDQQIRGFYNGNLVYNYSKGNTPFAIAERLWKYYGELRGYGFTPEDYLEHLTYLLLIRASELLLAPFFEESNVRERDNWAHLLGNYNYALFDRYWHALEDFRHLRHLGGIILSNAQNKFQNPRTLRMLIELIDREYQPEMGSTVLASIYEKLLEKCAESDKGRIGQYFTPHALSQGIVDIMRPEAWMRICDPACGVGEFLVDAYKYVANEKIYQPNLENLQQTRHDFISGWEENENIGKIGAMNLFIHGIATEAEFSPIRPGDSLLGMHIAEPFDMVLCNPPFGRRYNPQYEDSRAGWGISTGNAELAYIQLAYALLKPGGRAAIVAPNNVLFRKGAGEYIRRSLLGTCDFHTLLLLPENTFYYTGISGVVLFFDKLLPGEYPDTRELWIYDLRTDTHFTRRNSLRRKDFDDFVRCYNPENRHNRQETARFRRFSYEELLARENCNFNISWPIDEILTVDSANLDYRFSAWLADQQETRPRSFTDEQILWLNRIRDRISNAGSFTERDFERSPFTFDGGLVAARRLFGNELPTLLSDLNRLLSREE